MRFSFLAAMSALGLVDATRFQLVRKSPTVGDRALGSEPLVRGAGRRKMKSNKVGKRGKGSPCVSHIMCYSEDETFLETSNAIGEGNAEDEDELIGELQFGDLCVRDAGSDVVVDLTATTGHYQMYEWEADDDNDQSLVAAEGEITVGVELVASSSGATYAAVPQAVVTLDAKELGQNDEFSSHDDYVQGGVYGTMETHSAKFLFPNLPEDSYDVVVTVGLYAYNYVSLDSGDSIRQDFDVMLGPHVIEASVRDADDGWCPSFVEI